MKNKRFSSFSPNGETGSMVNHISSSSSSYSSSSAWSLDKLDSPYEQSLWLRTTHSELDKKMKAMMTLLEEADDSSVEREDILNKRKQQLIQMLEDFNRSYISIAEQCDQLSCKSKHFLHSSSPSTSSYFRKTGLTSNDQKIVAGRLNDPKLETSDSQSESVGEDADVECNRVNFHFEYLNRLADEWMPTEPCKMTGETETKVSDNENEMEATEIFSQERRDEDVWQ